MQGTFIAHGTFKERSGNIIIQGTFREHSLYLVGYRWLGFAARHFNTSVQAERPFKVTESYLIFTECSLVGGLVLPRVTLTRPVQQYISHGMSVQAESPFDALKITQQDEALLHKLLTLGEREFQTTVTHKPFGRTGLEGIPSLSNRFTIKKLARMKNKIMYMTLPRMFVTGMVRSLKATHSPPLD
jgi:hypothetical protein